VKSSSSFIFIQCGAIPRFVLAVAPSLVALAYARKIFLSNPSPGGVEEILIQDLPISFLLHSSFFLKE